MDYQQIDLFSSVNPYYKLKGEYKLIELFGGIGSQYKSLKALEKAQGDNKVFTIKHHKLCEWAYNSICMYNLIHIKDFTDYSIGKSKEELIELVKGISVDYNQALTMDQLKRKPLSWLQSAYNNIIATNNLIDISSVKGRDLDFDDKDQVIMSWSFPCQDLSLAGKMGGADEDSGTRSSLLYQVIRLLRERERERLPLPTILFMENVSALINQNNIHNMQKVEQQLASMGYTNFIQVLDTKDYGLPQHRERVFMISILGNYSYEFPVRLPLKYKLKDMLSKNVDDKYYLSEKMINYITAVGTKNFSVNNSKVNCNVARPLTTEHNKRAGTTNYMCDDLPENYDLRKTLGYTEKSLKRIEGNIVETDKESPTIMASSMQSINHQNCVLIINNTKKGYLVAHEGDGIDISSRMHHHRGNVQKGKTQTLQTNIQVGVVIKK